MHKSTTHPRIDVFYLFLLAFACSTFISGCTAQSRPKPIDLEPIPVDVKPLCLDRLVVARVSSALTSVNPSATVVCQSFSNNASPLCATVPLQIQLAEISPSSFDEDGFRMLKGDFSAFVDVPVRVGGRPLFVQEATDLAIRYQVLYDQNGQTLTLTQSTAVPGDIVATTSVGLIEHEIPIPAFPSGSTNRRVHIMNNDRFYGRFLSRMYFKKWSCVTNEPPNP